MRRESAALLMLAALMALSAWNIRRVDRLCSRIFTELEYAEQADSAQEAQQAMEAALDIWLSAKSYTHIFIRHPEIDACSDAFYEALEALSAEGSEEGRVNLRKLRYHLESIAGMERISLGNIF